MPRKNRNAGDVTVPRVGYMLNDSWSRVAYAMPADISAELAKLADLISEDGGF